ncbi:prephenate dehydrogenase [Streptomyces nigrescens]|uniref:Prephenate dehydrogenase n=1 Tax=Streptomyces nigrescens TaxID=1920 RepID=A0ABN6QTF4_STRNI|nr:prephenate dehydrogenase [Streptomyces nigrescens]BDM69459.1 prephenate dehydrogenase [Streptomyces nigrescens]
MHTACVVGTGLIGTSIALALTGRGVTTYLIDRDPDSVRIAAALGAGVPGPPPAPVDVAVIAVPPSEVARTIADHQKAELAQVYTDVSSVKALVHAECLALGCDTTGLVGGHPMAGGERSGPLTARADLFQDRHWILTPTPESRESALNRVLELVSLCGAVPVLLPPADHDRAVALVSHLPHLMASLTAARLVDGEEYAVRLAGRGMRDVTRTAAGDAGLWTDILAANAAALGPLLAELGRDLTTAARALARLTEDVPEQHTAALAELTGVLRRGSAGRARIAAPHGPAGADRHKVLSIAVGGPQRQLERLLGDVAEARVDLEGMVLPEAPAVPDATDGAVELWVARDVARPLTDALRDRGWAVR